jgi:hypothetical protein
MDGDCACIVSWPEYKIGQSVRTAAFGDVHSVYIDSIYIYISYIAGTVSWGFNRALARARGMPARHPSGLERAD